MGLLLCSGLHQVVGTITQAFLRADLVIQHNEGPDWGTWDWQAGPLMQFPQLWLWVTMTFLALWASNWKSFIGDHEAIGYSSFLPDIGVVSYQSVHVLRLITGYHKASVASDGPW